MTRFVTGTALAAAALLAITPLSAQDEAPIGADSAWTEHDAAARQAREARDWGAWRYHLVRMREQIGYHPSLVWSLARADALLGRTEDALAWLQTYADAGLTQDLAADSAFDSLRVAPGWTAVSQRIAANGQPQGSAQVAFTLADSAFLPEGIAFDPRSGRFFLASLRRGSIAACTQAGACTAFVPARRDSTWSMMALAVDTASRTLWATTAALPLYEGGGADESRSAVLAYDLETGALRRRYDAGTEGRHALGDLTLAPDGTVYVSDADEGVVYRIPPGGEDLEAFADEGLVSPQGLAVSADGRRLYVADYVRGLGSIDRASGDVSWVETADSVILAGTDGIVRVPGGLVAVQNGVQPKRVVHLTLDATGGRVTAWRALDAATPYLTEPTQVVGVGGEVFYVADSGWDRLNEDGSVKAGMSLVPAHVMRASLPRD